MTRYVTIRLTIKQAEALRSAADISIGGPCDDADRLAVYCDDRSDVRAGLAALDKLDAAIWRAKR